MPIYEYQCSKCGTLEVFQRITDEPLSRCPTCRGKVTKLVSQTSFQLKGTGWYVTDYARKSRDGASGDGRKDTARENSGSSEPSAAKDSSTPSTPSAKGKGGSSGSEAA
jgi:putative FmdB family regulatory protein